ncbi:MAG: hypothetical protein ABSF50_16020, partial [Burkholderiaceae bacterium]
MILEGRWRAGNAPGISLNASLTALFLVLACVFVVLAIIGGVRAYSPVPLWDMWDGYLAFFHDVKTGHPGAWLQQHVEHRPVLARLFFWIDLNFLRGTEWLLVALNYALMLCVCRVFWLAWRDTTTGVMPYLGWFLVAWLFSWSQHVNLTWGFQSAFIMAQLLPLLGLYLLYRSVASDPLSTRYFACACLCGVLAVGTLASGLLALPMMVLFALCTGMSRRRCLVLVILSTALIGLYLYDFHMPPRDTSPFATVRGQPFEVARYVLVYLGGPFEHLSEHSIIHRGISEFAGAVWVASVVFFAWKILRVARQSTLPLALLFFLLYVGAGAVLTAAGRLHLGVDLAVSSRYMTPAIMSWGALLILYVPKLESSIPRSREKIALGFVIMLAIMSPPQIRAVATQSNTIFEWNVAALAIELGVSDKAQISSIYPRPERALQIAEWPDVRETSIFALPPIQGARALMDQTMTESAGA